MKYTLEFGTLKEADLRRADLRGVDLRGADLRGADLFGADLRAADLRAADFRGARLCDCWLEKSRIAFRGGLIETPTVTAFDGGAAREWNTTKGGLHYCQEAGKCDCGTPPPVVIKIETDRRDETVWDEGKIISPRPPDGPDCRE